MNYKQLQPALLAANQNLNALQTLLSTKFGLTFSGKKCPADTSLSIWEKPNGDFVFIENGSNFTAINGKDFNGIIFTLGLKPAEVCQILALVGISTNAPAAAAAAESKAKATKPTNTETAKAAFSVCSWADTIGQKALEYLALKTGADLDTIKRHGVRPVSTFSGANRVELICSERLFKIAYPYEKGAKLVQISNGQKEPNKEYQYNYILGKGAIFGLNTLPDAGENLIICEGENDCICLNYFGQSLNTCAITFGSNAQTNPPADVIENLKSRFKNVFVLFDSRHTERKSLANAAAISDKHNLINLDFDFIALHLFNGGIFAPLQSAKLILGAKDICDVFGAFGANVLMQFISTAVGTGAKVAINPNDKFSVSFNDCLAFDFGQHISGANSVAKPILQPLDIIVSALLQYKKVVLQSAAGTGKSYALAGLIDKVLSDNSFFQSLSNDIDKVIICLPTLPLSEQLLKDMQANRPNTVLIRGGTSLKELEVAISGTNVILCTYDSSEKLLSIAKNCLFVIDEFHQLPSEIGYRSKAMQAVKVFLDNAPFSLLLSATPSYLLAKSLGAKLLLGRPTITNNISLSIFKYAPKPNINSGLYLLDTLIHKFLKARASGELPKDTAALVKLDNSTTLEAATNYINNLGLGLVSRCLYSGEQDVKNGTNKLLNSIQNNSTFSGEKIDILLVTCFLEAGVSIKENLCVINIDTKEAAKIIQFFSRPRLDLARGINQNVWAWSCVPETNDANELNKIYKALKPEFVANEKAAAAAEAKADKKAGIAPPLKLTKQEREKQRKEAAKELEKQILKKLGDKALSIFNAGKENTANELKNAPIFNMLIEFSQRENAAKAKAENANLHHKTLSHAEQKQHIYTVEHDSDFNLYFDENTDCFNANTIRIISILELEATKGQTPELLFSRITTLDCRVNLVNTQNLWPERLKKSHALQVSLTAKKSDNKDLEADFDTLFLTEQSPEKVIIYLANKSKSKNLKELLAGALGVNLKDEKVSANSYYSAMPNEKQSILTNLNTSKADKKLETFAFYINQKYSLPAAISAAFSGSATQIAADKLTAQQIKTGERLAQNTTIVGRAKLSALQLANATFDADVKKAFAQKRYNLIKRPNDKPITLPYILSVVNTIGKAHAVGREKSEKECLDLIKRLYNVETKRIISDEKKITTYTLGDLK
jgi:hypothetical protein